MLGAPILGWKRDAPKGRTSFRELQTDFRFSGTHWAKEYDMAFLFFLGVAVLKENFAAAGEPRL